MGLDRKNQFKIADGPLTGVLSDGTTITYGAGSVTPLSGTFSLAETSIVTVVNGLITTIV